jgi:hypothetical protein
VDNDPIVNVHANALLTGSGTTGIVLADLRDPAAILAHPELRGLIDFTRPVALLLVAILHFIICPLCVDKAVFSCVPRSCYDPVPGVCSSL